MERLKLGDICKIVSGGTPKTNIKEYWDGDKKWITPAELNDNSYIIADSVRKLTEFGVLKTGLTPFPEGTVILSSRAPIGKVAIASCEMYCNQGFKNFICTDKIYNKYLYWFLRSKTAYLNSLGRGATFKEISKQIVSDIEIDVPELSEQRQIVARLEKIAEIAELRKNEIHEIDNLIKSRFVEMFGGIHDSTLYPYATIESFTSVMSGGTPDRGIPEYWQEGNIRWVKTTELQNCVITDTEEKITQLGMDNSSTKLIPADSVLIAMYGQGKTRGMTGYIAVECATNQACACILPSKTINQKYLWQYMILSYDKLRDMAKGGNQPNLNTGIIKKYPVLMPPIALQEWFATFVQSVDKLKSAA